MKRWGLAAVVLAVAPVALAVALAVDAGLFSTTGSIGSATTKTETFRNPAIPGVYVQFHGPPGLVRYLGRTAMSSHKAGERQILVSKAQGQEACSFRAHGVTIGVYGSSSYTSGVCKEVRARLRRDGL